ncbi:alpha/beta hydrolase [Nocardia sp. 2]|uniref:Alpha/beta hydrolase n=1 Tax=Nocardia acididurans TaxID=2802282 RepID=A0ABS1M0H4_9NOCA|nr:alpha/beta hydrolase [Nocardia acididurans]MBL1074172.1 alpha/beta hydrolase [Nocardia acididurans]
MQTVQEGTLDGGLPHLSFGAGEPLVTMPGFMPIHGNPTGMTRRSTLAPLQSLATTHRVRLVSRRPGMRQGASIADVAADYADALTANFDGPVDVAGLSAGGAVALQLAADHPKLVRRLILVGCGHTWSPFGKAALREWVTRARAGRPPMRAMTGSVTTVPALRPLGRMVMWLNDLDIRGKDLSDGIAMATALAEFDCRDRLPDITAPTLLVAGDRDPLITAEIVDTTVRSAADARAVRIPRRGHLRTFTGSRLAREMEQFLSVAPR